MKCTEYFLHARQRPDRKRIEDAWIAEAISHPLVEAVQSDGRIRRWVYVTSERRYLRFILLEDGETVHNAFFDRGFRS